MSREPPSALSVYPENLIHFCRPSSRGLSLGAAARPSGLHCHTYVASDSVGVELTLSPLYRGALRMVGYVIR